VGVIIGGRQMVTNADQHDAMDGEIASRVFELIQLHDSRIAMVVICYYSTSNMK
jgi:hypothetical protein